MKLLESVLLFAVLILLATCIEAKKKHKYKSSDSSKSKTKTKWSTSTYNGDENSKTVVATEEHGYYIKRTFVPQNSTRHETPTLASPPYLAIPIAWFSCDTECAKGNTGTINGDANALQQGFLCDDDCTEPYEPICGKTPQEVAVFYNKCKLNVAKCRTHGLWTELAYQECKQSYANEVQYTERKFRSSPYFREIIAESKLEDPKEDKIMQAAIEAINEISDKLDEAEDEAHAATEPEGSGDKIEVTTFKFEVKN